MSDSCGQITWKLHDGRTFEVDVNEGDNLMEAATFEGVPGIRGDCGGAMTCCTCHVVVDDAWAGRVGPACDEEGELLEGAQAPRHPHSRLSCQIVVTAALDGLVVTVPKA